MNYSKLQLELELDENDNTIHVQIKGFKTLEEAEKYCEFIHKNANLIFFNSEVAH
jgi:hypothetical protein